jgi:hypothetical protein
MIKKPEMNRSTEAQHSPWRAQDSRWPIGTELPPSPNHQAVAIYDLTPPPTQFCVQAPIFVADDQIKCQSVTVAIINFDMRVNVTCTASSNL